MKNTKANKKIKMPYQVSHYYCLQCTHEVFVEKQRKKPGFRGTLRFAEIRWENFSGKLQSMKH